MHSRLRLALFVILGSASLVGCTTTGANTFADPSLATTRVGSVAILPLQNTRLGPAIALDVNRGVVQGLSARNPGVRLMGPAETQEKLGAAGLIETYSQYLRDYATSSLTNKSSLLKIGEALGTDAMLQGEITDLQQQNGYPYHPAYTQIVVRYSLVSLHTGVLLWETSARARRKLTALDHAPDPREVIPVVQQTLIREFPFLGAR